MKLCIFKIKYIFIILCFLNFLKLKAQEFSLNNFSEQQSQILIESNNQKSDFKNLVFYAEGEVIITNSDKAIFYKSSGKIRLIGDVEVVTSDSSKIKAGEIIYYLEENNFEAISDLKQRVNTKFVFNEKKVSN